MISHNRLEDFLSALRERDATSVLEVGCGAGRDGAVIHRAAFDYTGVDLSATAIEVCSTLGLRAVQADATHLPFKDNTFDAAWSMSTLMHLPKDDFEVALAELRRVVRPGGIVAIGVWGHTENRDWFSSDGRFFRHRSDEALKEELARGRRALPMGQDRGPQPVRPGSLSCRPPPYRVDDRSAGVSARGTR